jgi:hypothetical protein
VWVHKPPSWLNLKLDKIPALEGLNRASYPDGAFGNLRGEYLQFTKRPCKLDPSDLAAD